MKEDILSNKTFDVVDKKNKIMSKIVYSVKFLAKTVVNFCLLVLILITFLVSLVFVDDKINKMRGIDVPPLASAYVIVSPSMTPTIRVQDAVIVFRADNYKIGDIITFKSSDSRYSGYTITHRINNIVVSDNGKKMFITKGDNNSIVDSEPVLMENIYGKVSIKIPFLGFLQKLLFQPFGFFLIILVPSIIFVVYNMIVYLKYIKEEKKEMEAVEIETGNVNCETSVENVVKEEIEII